MLEKIKGYITDKQKISMVYVIIFVLEFFLLFTPVRSFLFTVFHKISSGFSNVEVWIGFLFYIDLWAIFLTVAFAFRKRINQKYFCSIFIVLLSLFFFASIVSMAIGNGYVHFYGGGWDFSDLIVCYDGYYKAENLYSTNYPPLAVIVYKFLGALVNSVPELNLYSINFMLTLFFAVVVACSALLIYYSIKANNYIRVLAVLAFIFSGPFMFGFERMNLLLLSIPLTLFYLCFYDSENKINRELAIIALALAGNIKLYPAIFGFLLVKDKRWWQGIRCAIYGIGLFILPALVGDILGLFMGDHALFGHVIDYVSATSEYVGYRGLDFLASRNLISIKAIVFRLLFCDLHIAVSESVKSILLNISLVLYVILSFVLFFNCKKRYQQYLILGLMCVFVPTIQYYYSVVFLLPAILVLLKQEKYDGFDIICGALLLMMFIFTANLHDLLIIILGPKLIFVFMVVAIDVLVQFIKAKKSK